MSKICSLLLALTISVSMMAQTFSTFDSRTDFRDESIYFLMTTRFYDGDLSNNTHCWDSNGNSKGDPEWRGDFKGLIERLDYIKALGFTAIWITPIVENASGLDYHGYHASNFSAVDRRYETHSAEGDVLFQDVITAAHARGMKVILDIVLNHTGNFGETNLCPEFRRDWTADQSDINACLQPIPAAEGGKLASNYLSMPAGSQYHERLKHMKNMDNVNSDNHNYYHHAGAGWNWDETNRWLGQIAGDCVDLNTENAATAAYLRRCYEKFIKMGVDGFRIDTSGHIARISFNKNFIPQFTAAGAANAAARGAAGTPFYMFGEVCARYSDICYRDHDNLSPYFYTWAENKAYANSWDSDTTGASWNSYVSYEGDPCNAGHPNYVAMTAQGTQDYAAKQGRTSQNALLNGNNYHTPDYSQASGFHVIDFTMHHNFVTANQAWNIAQPNNDKYYNDATWNVVYVDSHDYAPNGAPEEKRFDQPEDVWAENMSLMFTHRGIPCVYYGSEVQFMKGALIDKGAELPLKQTGRAYFGGYMTGTVNATDFGTYTATGNVAQTLNAPLAKHLIRLNKIRQSVTALRKGQYSVQGCSGSGIAFKRRYTNGSEDSFALICISGGATFSGIHNGTYKDCVTGDVKTVSNGTLTASCSGKGNLRVYVLNGPGKIGDDEYYSYGSARPAKTTPTWDGNQEALLSNEEDPWTPGGNTGGGGSCDEPADTITPCLGNADQICAFFNSEGSSITCGVTAHLWGGTKGTSWPGKAATYLGAGMWKVVVPAECGTPTKIIWSASGSNQTADLDFDNQAIYKVSGESGGKPNAIVTGHVTLLCDEDDSDTTVVTPPSRPDTITGACRIYYSGSYTTPYIWAWETGGVNYTGGTWPGQPMIQDTETFEGNPLWYYEFTDVLPSNVLFSNNGKPQTADLVPVDCDYVYTGSEWKPLHATTALDETVEQVVNVWAEGNTLHVVTSMPQNIAIYSAQGQMLRVFPMMQGECTVNNVPAGIYLVGGKKVIVK